MSMYFLLECFHGVDMKIIGIFDSPEKLTKRANAAAKSLDEDVDGLFWLEYVPGLLGRAARAGCFLGSFSEGLVWPYSEKSGTDGESSSHEGSGKSPA